MEQEYRRKNAKISRFTTITQNKEVHEHSQLIRLFLTASYHSQFVRKLLGSHFDILLHCRPLPRYRQSWSPVVASHFLAAAQNLPETRSWSISMVVYLFVVASENIWLCGFVWPDRVEWNLYKDRWKPTRPLKSLLPSTVGPKGVARATSKSPYTTETHFPHVNNYLRDLEPFPVWVCQQFQVVHH